MAQKKIDPAFTELTALVEQFLREWPGPDPVPHGVAHQDPRSGRLTFHLRGLPEHLAFIAAALRGLPSRSAVSEPPADAAPVSTPTEAIRQLYDEFRQAHDGDASSNDLAQLVDDWFVGQGYPTVLFSTRPERRS